MDLKDRKSKSYYYEKSKADSKSRRSRSRSSSPPVYEDRKKKFKERAEIYKEEKRKLKEWAKAVETPEEKRARRLAKKEEKERKRKGKMGWDEEDLGYTNTNNPFGDHNLREAFTWRKKNEKAGITETDLHKLRQKQKQDEMRVELQKVKQRRLERERELAAREEERTMMQRQKEADMSQEWEKQSEDFHLDQARKRSKIRIKDGRAKPIDLLAEYVNPDADDFELQINEPHSVLIGLSIDDVEDLLEDVKIYMQLEQGSNEAYWKDIILICKDELEKLKIKKYEGDSRNQRDVINTAVQSDVVSIFKGKTYTQLIALEKQMRQKIKTGGAIDIGYWESLLQQCKVHLAKARLRESHQRKLKQKLSELRRQANDESSESEQPSPLREENVTKTEPKVDDDPTHGPSGTSQKDEGVEKEGIDSHTTVDEQEQTAAMAEGISSRISKPQISEEEMAVEAYQAYETGCYSPRLIPLQDVEETKWVDPDDDIHKLGYLRMQVQGGSTVDEEEEAEKEYSSESKKALGDDEEAFNVPFKLTEKTYSWKDKYRPRKPRFFNRVHTGYEWNKYNQTHYDSDNPPPKIVQGYKFNIFYPELIDKTKTPEYTLKPCKDNPDFGILTFSGGPPYEDIAFKVVNREWELAHRHGFRCQFQNNVFQLWFHFKRYRYRR
eukprot:gene9683-10670_t